LVHSRNHETDTIVTFYISVLIQFYCHILYISKHNAKYSYMTCIQF